MLAPGSLRSSQRRKERFNIDKVLDRIRVAIEPYAKAALFELADDGFNSVFQQLIACIISTRTRDEVTLPTARRLFTRAGTAKELARLSTAQIDDLIRPATFHQVKAPQIREIARITVDQFGGRLPCDRDVLLGFHGVGTKCANLVLGIACHQTRISVDVHVHRVTNRWGYVKTRTPEQTTRALEEKLPRTYWIEINRLLVPFGKHVCTGTRPRCSSCPVLSMCRQVGVTGHR